MRAVSTCRVLKQEGNECYIPSQRVSVSVNVCSVGSTLIAAGSSSASAEVVSSRLPEQSAADRACATDKRPAMYCNRAFNFQLRKRQGQLCLRIARGPAKMEIPRYLYGAKYAVNSQVLATYM